MTQIIIMAASLLLSSSCSKHGSSPAVESDATPSADMQIVIQGESFAVSLQGNSTAAALLAMLPMTIDMQEMNGNEKYYLLPNSLPRNASRPSVIHGGDLMLYGDRTLVLFYETHNTSYSYTRIGRVDNVAQLRAALGAGSVEVKFELR